MEEFSKQLLRQADLGWFSCPSGPAFARPGTSSLTVEADGRRLLSVCREVVLSTLGMRTQLGCRWPCVGLPGIRQGLAPCSLFLYTVL